MIQQLKVEVELTLCTEDRNQKRVLLSGVIISRKARHLSVHLQEPVTAHPPGRFQAPGGWFNKFKVQIASLPLYPSSALHGIYKCLREKTREAVLLLLFSRVCCRIILFVKQKFSKEKWSGFQDCSSFE